MRNSFLQAKPVIPEDLDVIPITPRKQHSKKDEAWGLVVDVLKDCKSKNAPTVPQHTMPPIKQADITSFSDLFMKADIPQRFHADYSAKLTDQGYLNLRSLKLITCEELKEVGFLAGFAKLLVQTLECVEL